MPERISPTDPRDTSVDTRLRELGRRANLYKQIADADNQKAADIEEQLNLASLLTDSPMDLGLRAAITAQARSETTALRIVEGDLIRAASAIKTQIDLYTGQTIDPMQETLSAAISGSEDAKKELEKVYGVGGAEEIMQTYREIHGLSPLENTKAATKESASFVAKPPLQFIEVGRVKELLDMRSPGMIISKINNYNERNSKKIILETNPWDERSKMLSVEDIQAFAAYMHMPVDLESINSPVSLTPDQFLTPVPLIQARASLGIRSNGRLATAIADYNNRHVDPATHIHFSRFLTDERSSQIPLGDLIRLAYYYGQEISYGGIQLINLDELRALGDASVTNAEFIDILSRALNHQVQGPVLTRVMDQLHVEKRIDPRDNRRGMLDAEARNKIIRGILQGGEEVILNSTGQDDTPEE